MTDLVTIETTVKLHGSADAIVELEDNWDGMGLMAIRIGVHDGTGGIAWWTNEPIALGWDMVRALGKQLTKMADERDGSSRMEGGEL